MMLSAHGNSLKNEDRNTKQIKGLRQMLSIKENSKAFALNAPKFCTIEEVGIFEAHPKSWRVRKERKCVNLAKQE